MKYLRSQSGFAHWLLVVVLVSAIAGAGYFAYTNFRSAGRSASEVVSSSSPSPSSTPDPTAEWRAFTSADGKFSLKYPSNWVTGDCNGDGIVNLFLATKTSHLGVCQSDSPGQISIMSLAGDRLAEYKGQVVWDETAIDGTKAYVRRTTNGSFMSPDYKIAVSKTYLFVKNGRTFELNYMQDTNRGFSDIESDFTTMAEKTFRVQ